ncbi:MAG TPA: UDP-glucose/GDP-mannose dehydrogenase family protein [Ktedonobacterales bacterium]
MVGTGYVGLVTGACFAKLGNSVTCLDVDEDKIKLLLQGKMPIYEPGLESLVKHNVQVGRLRFTTNYEKAVKGADYIFIAVGTPTQSDGDGADMQYVDSAAEQIGRHLTKSAIIVNKSTMPVGAGNHVMNIIREHLRDSSYEIAVVSNPEFLREGSAVEDFLKPDRVVLGSSNPAAAQRVAELYLPLRAPMVITDLNTAEMIKYASNAFLAAKISFINEIARICERLGADVKEVAAGMGYDRRIGRPFLDAGLGYGGSCFPKDVRALAHMAEKADTLPELLRTVMKINEDQRHLAIEKLKRNLGGEGSLRGKKVAMLGLAFKANTDDMRDAPSVDIVRALLDADVVEIRAYDPVAKETAAAVMPGDERIQYCKNAYEAVKGVDGALIVTEWGEFRELDLIRLRDAMARRDGGPVLIDGRNLFDAAEMKRLGFRYEGVGHGVAPANSDRSHLNGAAAVISGASGPSGAS